MKLSIVFEDHRIAVEYANGVSKMVDFWTNHGGHFEGNTTTKVAFTDVVESVGHNMDDYWAIQYSGGQMDIEYANGHPNQVISGNTGLSEYVSLVDTWSSILADEEEQASIQDAEVGYNSLTGQRKTPSRVPTWGDIRKVRDEWLLNSDKIVAWSIETGNEIPQEWKDYRQDLRDITSTYNAPTGNTELIIFPHPKPSWPSA